MTSVRIAQSRKAPPRAARAVSAAPRTAPPEGLRRVLNIGVAAVGVLAVTPLMVVIATLIKLTSPGPVFYVQTRVGIDRRAFGTRGGNNRRHSDLGGKPFRIFKFRTMVAPRNGNAAREVWAQQDDPRITPIGKILRLYRLDELPQLLNVLLGDMNVVGPRPEQPTIFADLREQIGRYHERQRVRPGITGWAQINQSYDSCLDDVRKKLEFDLEYVERQSAIEDLRIMVRTVPVLIGKQGAR